MHTHKHLRTSKHKPARKRRWNGKLKLNRMVRAPTITTSHSLTYLSNHQKKKRKRIGKTDTTTYLPTK
jgi:hypothetical protein